MNYNTGKEVWKDINGYEGRYQISNTGRVKSLKRKYVTKDKIITGTETSDGYKQVQLRKHQVVETRLINSLRKEHFPDDYVINENVFCATCDKPLRRKPSELKRNVTGLFFCSTECDAILRGKKKLERSLNDIQNRIGTSDFKSWLLDRYVKRRKTTQEISLEAYGEKRNDTAVCDWLRRYDIPIRKAVGKGEEHWNYNFRKTDEERVLNRRYPEYTKWRENVFERDCYTCQNCGKTGGKLNAHHLNGYDNFEKLRTKVENGVTLCETCHDDFHNIYGRGNNVKEQFLEYKDSKASNI